MTLYHFFFKCFASIYQRGHQAWNFLCEIFNQNLIYLIDMGLLGFLLSSVSVLIICVFHRICPLNAIQFIQVKLFLIFYPFFKKKMLHAIKFTFLEYTIQQFLVYSQRLCNHQYCLTTEHFHHSQKKSCTLAVTNHSSFFPDPGNCSSIILNVCRICSDGLIYFWCNLPQRSSPNSGI